MGPNDTEILVTIVEDGKTYEGRYSIAKRAIVVDDPAVGIVLAQHGLQQACQQAFQSYANGRAISAAQAAAESVEG